MTVGGTSTSPTAAATSQLEERESYSSQESPVQVDRAASEAENANGLIGGRTDWEMTLDPRVGNRTRVFSLAHETSRSHVHPSAFCVLRFQIWNFNLGRKRRSTVPDRGAFAGAFSRSMAAGSVDGQDREHRPFEPSRLLPAALAMTIELRVIYECGHGNGQRPTRIPPHLKRALRITPHSDGRTDKSS